MKESLFRARRGVMWYLKQATGEAKWDEYVERCAREGTEPMSRREFERHRADHKEANPQSRCC
ncbi:MAG TPA: YbdD/YjiX family protein [Nocardioidaceae bacterium]|nr:YbdD/YjiX family protein [Nocardioidaceae bacterium]